MATATVDNNVSCNGGSNGGATASATGGTTTYSYLWSNAATTASITGVAAGTYTVTVTDANGCTSTASATVTQPTVLTASTSVNNNVSCNGGADGSATASGSGGTTTYSYLWSNSATTATATGLSAGTYTVTVTDANGCTATATATITEPAVLTASASVNNNVSCNGGANGSATAAGSGGTTTYSYLWSNSATTATATGLNAGTYTVTVTDANGCTATASTTITEPTTPLSASVVVDSNTTCASSATGVATATPAGGTPTYSYNWSNSSTTNVANNLGTGTYTVTVTDANGCTVTNSITIVVEDTVDPTAIAQNLTVYLNAAGQVTILANSVDNGSYDDCEIDTITISQSNFDCSDIGSNSITMTVLDVNGNSSSTSATITVIDTIAPTVLVNNITVYLDNSGNASINASMINNGSYDSCGIGSMSLDNTTFACADSGSNNVVLTVTDVNGNASSATAVVTVMDTVSPNMSSQNFTAYLNASGDALILVNDINNGSSDNCDLDTMWLDQYGFVCADTGTNTVTLFGRDVSGNIGSVSAIVTVLDTISPTATTQNIIAYLDMNGDVTVTDAMVDNGSYDNCGIQSYTLSQEDFDCGDVGNNTVTLTIVDFSGNTSSTNATVTVMDTVSPTVMVNNLTVYLDVNGSATITTAMIDNGSYDSCGIASMTLSQTSFGCGDLGANNVTLIATDVNGNSSGAVSIVTVLDTLTEVAINIDNIITCNGLTNGQLTASASGMLSTYSYSWNTTATAATIGSLGAGTYTVTATDANGCFATAEESLVEPSALAGTLAAADITCFGAADGYVKVTASGGTTGYNYSWNNSSSADSIGGLSGGTFTVTVTDANGCGITLDTTLFEPTQLVVSVDLPDPSLCVGDSIGIAAAIASGGTTPYGYAWQGYASTNDTLFGLPAGTYTVNILDANGCLATNSATITQDTLPIVSLNLPLDSVCESTIPTALSGGMPLSGTYSGLGVSGGNFVSSGLSAFVQIGYAFTDANGCTGAASDSIWVTPIPNISFSLDPVELCGGQSIALNFASPSGGIWIVDSTLIDTANMTIVAPDEDLVLEGVYAYANVCFTDTDTFAIITHANPVVDLGEDILLCNASTIELNAGNHTSYHWFDGSQDPVTVVNDGEEPLTQDLNAWVSVTNEFGCEGSDTVLIDISEQPTFYLGDNIQACLKESITLTVDNVYDNFMWSTGETGTSILAHDGSVIMPGPYQFWVEGSNNSGDCSFSDTIYITLEDCDSSYVGVEEPVALTEVSFSVYPNPTRDFFNVGSQLSTDRLDRVVMIGVRGEIARIYNVSTWTNTTEGQIQLDIRDLSNGIYIMQIEHELGVNTARVIVGK
ncbi:MAG: T9SS type A sorting domain-containing protein [Flavobacteriales bacterium]